MGERFTTLIGAAVPLVRDNIDTDFDLAWIAPAGSRRKSRILGKRHVQTCPRTICQLAL